MPTRTNNELWPGVAMGCCALVSLGNAASPGIDAQRITADVRELASDAYEGRAPATAGEAKTLDYIIGQLKAAGLQPGGDVAGKERAWTQDVPLMRAETRGPISVTVEGGGATLAWKQSEDLVIRAAQTGTDRVALDAAPLVFVGYGVSAPERNWDDFKGSDLKGKVALVLVNDPDFETGQGDFGGKAMTYYGRWTYKFEEAARRGAAGVLVIHENEPASYGWATVGNSDAGPMFDVVRQNPLAQHVPVEGWIQRASTVELFRRAGLDFDALKLQARARDFKPVLLSGVSVSTSFAVSTQRVISKNVVAVVPGTKHPEERIIYTAHWDHLGISRPDARGDTIYNGAVDNAAGVAQLLEIARAYARAPRSERTVMFLFVTAEEKGLLGTEYYAGNPLYPLATTVANLNTDSPRPTAPAKDFATSGDGATTLQDDLIATGKLLGRVYAPDAQPQAGRFFRSDHFALAKRGVPAVSFKSGDDLVAGGRPAGEAWGKEYTANKYHQPADEFDAKTWRSDGIAADATFLYDVGRSLANSRKWPGWKTGSEFKAIRDASAAQRR